MKYKEKIKVLARLDDKAYEEEFDEDDYSILKELSYDKELTIRALVARILVDSSDEKGEEIEIRSKNKKNPYVSQHNSKGIGTQVRIWGK